MPPPNLPRICFSLSHGYSCLRLHVALVPNDGNWTRPPHRTKLIHPFGRSLETVWVGDVVDEQGPIGISIIYWCQGVETLLACSVPQIELHRPPRNSDLFLYIGRVLCGRLPGIEGPPNIASQERGFAYTTLPKHDNLEGTSRRTAHCIPHGYWGQSTAGVENRGLICTRKIMKAVYPPPGRGGKIQQQ